jgi:hypothetical protein
MKNILLILIVFFVDTITCQSQTYLSPVLGMDLTKLQNNDKDPAFVNIHITDKGYSLLSEYYGVKIEHVLSKSVSVFCNANFTHKHVNALIFDFVAKDGFNFNYLRTGIAINFRVLNFLSIGVGGNFNSLKNFKYTLHGNVNNEFISSYQDYGISILPRIYWKNFELNPYYYKGLNSNQDKSGLNIKPVQSLGVSLSYKIKIFNKYKNKGVTCPKF